MISPYLAQQLSGPISQSVINSTKDEFDKTQIELDYMLSADIDTSRSDFLYLLGQWAGLPWPSAPIGTFEENQFEFGSYEMYPQSSIRGFNAGLLSSVSINELVFYPAEVYVKILKAYSKIRSSGVSLASRGLVASFWPHYSLSYNADKDLVFTFMPNISGAYLYALRAIMPYVTVSPQVVYEQG